MNQKFIALQLLGVVGSWVIFMIGVDSAWCLAPLMMSMSISAIGTLV